MVASDFDLARPNVFKTDLSFDVAYDEVDGVKKNARIGDQKFGLGGVKFRLSVDENNSDDSVKYPFKLMSEVAEESRRDLDDNSSIEIRVTHSPDKTYFASLDAMNPKRSLFHFMSACGHFNLNIVADFKCTQLYRLPFVDAEAAKKNRSGGKIILGDDLTKPIYVNKTLLAMHSDFFQTLFFGDFQEKDQEEVKLSDVTEADFLQYLYCVQPPIKPFVFENLEAPLRLADRFQNDVLLRSIENFLYKKAKMSGEKRQTLIWAGRYQMQILFHETLEKMEKADFKDLDCTATAQFNRAYLEAFHKRILAVMFVTSG